MESQNKPQDGKKLDSDKQEQVEYGRKSINSNAGKASSSRSKIKQQTAFKVPVELQEEWNQKLRDSGFVDKESWLPNGMVGPITGEYRVQEDTQEYFRMVSIFLHHYRHWSKMRFAHCSPEQAREMWSLYADGYNGREITEIMNKPRKFEGTVRTSIKRQKSWFDRKIKAMEAIMLKWFHNDYHKQL